ncbi:hypothetical protein [Thioalkalivibrio sp. ARh3]|uniref:hypothetical protein n=1 Tax=Thioalkalivibrio sp. ARh3 TaxID=1158148 RepID=UPI0003617991|nr:hypothetical protein [Thioalkalivibrio sp. ARh3]
MEVPVSNPSAAVPLGTRPTGSDRLGLGQTSAPAEFDRPLNDPEAGEARRPIEDDAEQDSDRRGGDQSERSLDFGARSEQELSSRARISAEQEAARMRRDGDDQPDESALRDGGSLGQDGVEALRRRVELAVRLAGPTEEPRRELNVII